MNRLLFHHLMEAPHVICFNWHSGFRCRLKMLMPTPNHCLFYKLFFFFFFFCVFCAHDKKKKVGKGPHTIPVLYTLHKFVCTDTGIFGLHRSLINSEYGCVLTSQDEHKKKKKKKDLSTDPMTKWWWNPKQQIYFFRPKDVITDSSFMMLSLYRPISCLSLYSLNSWTVIILTLFEEKPRPSVCNVTQLLLDHLS